MFVEADKLPILARGRSIKNSVSVLNSTANGSNSKADGEL